MMSDTASSSRYWSRSQKRKRPLLSSSGEGGSLVLFGTGFAAGVLLVLLCSSRMATNNSTIVTQRHALWTTEPLWNFPIASLQRVLGNRTTPPAVSPSTPEPSSSTSTTIRNVALVELGCFLVFRGVPRLVTKLALHSRRTFFLISRRGRLWQGAVKLYSRTSLSKIVNRGKKVVKVWWYRTRRRRRRNGTTEEETEP